MYAYIRGIHHNLNSDDIIGIHTYHGIRGWATVGVAISSNVAVASNADDRLHILLVVKIIQYIRGWQILPGDGWSV